MKKKITALLVALALLLGTPALAAVYRISDENNMNFGRLGIDLLRAVESPSPDDQQAIDSVLDAIGAMSASDREVAQAIVDHWMRIYVNADGAYQSHIHYGGDRAPELEGTAIPDSATHAFVVLGFKLKNGQMTDELMQRCDAAAAAARSFPNTLLICSGGATGSNNPKKHTEAGLMKAYLTEKCGIDASRIVIDEKARSTLQNAENTFKIMQALGVQTYTLVTSAYHQRWGQVIYNTMCAFYRQSYGYGAELVENYSCNITESEDYSDDPRWGLYKLTVVLDLPDDVVEAMKKALK